MVPYATCDVDGSLVVQLIVAESALIPLAAAVIPPAATGDRCRKNQIPAIAQTRAAPVIGNRVPRCAAGALYTLRVEGSTVDTSGPRPLSVTTLLFVISWVTPGMFSLRCAGLFRNPPDCCIGLSQYLFHGRVAPSGTIAWANGESGPTAPVCVLLDSVVNFSSEDEFSISPELADSAAKL